MEVAGTAVGIASLGIQICQSVLSYYEAWRSYHQDICDACNKASQLEKTFALLDDTLQAPDLEPERRTRVADCLESCATGLQRFEKKYRKLKSVDQPAGMREKAAAAAKRSLYPFKVSTLAKMTEMLDDLLHHLSFTVQVLQVDLMKASRNDIVAVRALAQTLNSKVDSLQIDVQTWQKNDKYHKDMAWLGAPDPATSHSTARHKHEAGTGSWLLTCDSYLHWKANPGSHLWLNGKAGSGKTLLCSTVIQDLDSHCNITHDMALAYFYFSFAEADKQSYDSLLASLLLQLCDSHPPFKHLEEVYDKGGRPSRALLVEALSIACKQHPEVLLVLDALDELPEGNERQAVLTHLAELKQNATNVKVITTSRCTADIEESMNSCGVVSLPINLTQVNEDIRLYVASQFSQVPRLQSWRLEMQRRVQETFQRKADGMFRWAYCQLESLKQLRSTREKSIEDALRCLPVDLDTTYERMLARIDPYSLDEALTMLRWLCFGESLLTLGELQDARLTSPNEDGTVSWDDPGSIHDIIEILGDLVYVEDPTYVMAGQQHWSSQAPRSRIAYKSYQSYVKQHSSNAAENLTEADRKRLYEAWLLTDGKSFSNIRLAHFSVKEYLLSGRILHSLCNDFNLQRTAAREFLAQSCLVYLLHYSKNESRRASAADFTTFPLLRHAALRWSSYVDCDGRELLRHELRFLQDDKARIAWVRVLTSNENVWDQTQKPKYMYGTALYFASSLGHRACVVWFLKQTVNVDAVAGPYGTALQAASANGHQAIVDLLLNHGANANALRTLSLAYTVTALCAASTYGHLGIVLSLLANGADPNMDSEEPFRCRPLYAASYKGYTDIVASLIRAGADINHYGDHRGTAIRIAAEKGFDQIVQLLLDAGSGVDAVDEIVQHTPLAAALHAGHQSIARRLIESEAIVTIPDAEGVTALEIAAEEGYIDLLELMLEVGWGVDWEGAKSSALLAAIRYGYLDGVRIWVKHGASVHGSQKPAFTPLCAACLYGREQIAELLIKAGAQVNIGADLETEQRASPNSHRVKPHQTNPSDEQESGLDVYRNRPWMVAAPPLHRAAWRGHTKIVSLLLQAGATVDARRSGSTALQEASFRGHAEVVKLLLEAGADEHADSGDFGTPAEAAMSSGSGDVTEVLLDWAAARRDVSQKEQPLVTVLKT